MLSPSGQARPRARLALGPGSPPGQPRSWAIPSFGSGRPRPRPDPTSFPARRGPAQPTQPAQPEHGWTPGSQRCWRPGQYPGRNRLRPVLAPGPYLTPIQCRTPTPCQAGVREDLTSPDSHPTTMLGLPGFRAHRQTNPQPRIALAYARAALASSRGATTHTQAQHQPVVAPQHLLGGALDRSSKDRPTMSGRSHRCGSLLVDDLRVISSPVRALG
jgi:hypothetical protein